MIDWTKPVETDEDEPSPVRVLCTDGPFSAFPVVCIVYGNIRTANIDGVLNGNGTNLARLRNARPKPVKREGWSIVDTDKLIFDSKDEATSYLDNLPSTLRKLNGLVIAHIEWEEKPE